MTQPQLFDAIYPNHPGARNTDTSIAAADSIAPKAATLRQMCLVALKAFDAMTADECAFVLNVDKLAIRPRFSELVKMGLIVDSGKRKLNKSKKKAIVWKLK